MGDESPPEVPSDLGSTDPVEPAPPVPLDLSTTAPVEPAPPVPPDLGTTDPVEPAPPVPDTPLPPPEAPLERRRSKAVPIAVGAAILAVIIAVVAIAVGGGKKSSSSAHPSPSAVVAAPTGFTAIPQPFSITLNWVAPPGGQVTSYTILRNGVSVGTVQAPATTYTDAGVVPGQSYTYEVEADVGTRTSTDVSLIVQTPVPALGDARLDGHYRAKTKYLQQTGYVTTPKPRTLDWIFTPLCATGPCNVSWLDEFYTQIRATLRRSGTSYHGADSGFFGGGCSGKKTVQNLTLTIRVVTAKAVAGEWVASKFVGTIIEHDDPQLGCVGPTATISVTGTLSA